MGLPHPISILHVSPSLGVGGRELRMATLIDELGAGYHHHLMALDGNVAFLKFVSHGERCTVHPFTGRGVTGTLRGVRRLITSLRPALVATYNWGAIDGVMAALSCRHGGIVHTEDGFSREESRALLRRRVLARRVLLPRTAAVVAISNTLADIARSEFCIPAGKLHHIANGIDTQRFRPGGGTALRDTLGIPRGSRVIGMVGRLSPEKNIELMLNVLPGLPDDVHLMIAGEGPSRETLEETTRRLHLQGRVHFLGAQSDTRPCYAAMDVFALSSTTEQLSLSLLEAMACGLPAVTTDVGDCSAVLSAVDGFIPTVPSGDAPVLERALMTLLEEPQLRARLGETNRGRCETRYAKGGMISAYDSLYRSIALATT